VESAAADFRSVTNGVAPDIQATLANVRHITESLSITSDHLERFVADNEPGLSKFTHQNLPQLEQLLRESRDAARDLRDLSRSLKENPSELLYESTYHGVEVPR
jgi:ABC-type transporter Mla subunit MlaD